jgi:DNA-binding transcriptional MerR regulator
MAGITKNTFLRWVREGTFPDVEHRDRRGWRLFTEQEVLRLKKEVSRISKVG